MQDEKLSGVPGTGLWGLKARAEEHSKANGLFKDPLAAAWWPRLAPFFSDALSRWYTPVLQQSIAMRTDILDTCVRSHIQQPGAVVIEMGAGFSTRYHRIQPQADWYELDLGEVIDLRMSLKEPLAPRHFYLSDSLFATEWMRELSNYPPENLLFIAEGLFMYFPLERVIGLFEDLQRHFKGAQIAFDVLGQRYLKAAQAPGEEVDAPVFWGVQQISKAVEPFGLELVQDLSLPSQMQTEPKYRKGVSMLARQILKIPLITRGMGGTLLARFPDHTD